MWKSVSFVVTLLALGTISAASASSLVYRPSLPSFGGSPAVGQYLMSKAQIENDHTGKSSSYTPKTALERFQENLERQILSIMSRRIIDEAFGDWDSGLPEDGNYDTDKFSIDITHGDNEISIIILDKETGEITEMVMPVMSTIDDIIG